MSVPLDLLAQRYGIRPSYPGADGRPVAVSDEVRRYFLTALGVAEEEHDAGAGAVGHADRPSVTRQCYLPEWLRARPAWGIAAQLYELRSHRNWGVGDFADLAVLCEIAGAQGAQFVGLNPLHALFLADPERCSPFSPSNRRFLNPLYIAVDQLAGYIEDSAERSEIDRLRDLPFVDYAGVSRLKLVALRRVWQRTRPTPPSDMVSAQEDRSLRRHAIFEALSLHMAAQGHDAGWRKWPRELSRADSAEVAAFAEANSDEVAFHMWLQVVARRQLADAAERARASGMRIGLYLDFAVGEAPDGSATWSDPELAVAGVAIGAPPDVFSEHGQHWGLTPLSPIALAERGADAYRSLMEAAMRRAGALRLDHAMSLRQLFWIPEEQPASAGGFVLYPTEALLSALAAASESNRTIVIGEDLGHVPEGFRELMAEAAILSYRILYFERDGGGFREPRSWPELALCCLSTHDLPTLKGWWQGSDVALRLEHGLIDEATAALQFRDREAERVALINALLANGGLDDGEASTLRHKATPDGADLQALVVAAHRFLARTPSLLTCLRLADAVGEEHPTNLPGTSAGYPNWRRKLAVSIEDLPALPLFRAATRALAEERP